MMIAFMLAVQTPGGSDEGLQPPRLPEARAAEQRNRRQLPVIVRICRDAVRSDAMEEYVKNYADRNGLSTYGRLALTLDCDLYRQGMQDGGRSARRRD